MRSVSSAIVPLFEAGAPDLVLVQGDTGSALGGALAASIAGTSIGHVEAGLRSHDRRHPWPEEEFRIAIDGLADLLFAPTELSAANLRREGGRGAIHVTGNSGIDAVLAIQDRLPPPQAAESRKLLVTCHRRENWGEGISSIAAAVRRIASEVGCDVEIILHPNPALAGHVRQMLIGEPRIRFRPACSHAEMVSAMLESTLILTDSGGLQEEASALGVPLLVLREKSERPEAIASGNMELVGTDPDRIVGAVRRWMNARSPASAMPFGDGKAGERIAAIVAEWLGRKSADETEGVFPRQGRRANAWQ